MAMLPHRRPEPMDFPGPVEYRRAMEEWEYMQRNYRPGMYPAPDPMWLMPPPQQMRYIGADFALDKAAPPKPQFDLKKVAALKQAAPRKALAPVPDMVAPIVAWRAWKVSGKNLQALGKSVIWEPKKIIEAACDAVGHKDAPVKDCQCGIWAFKSDDNLIKAVTAGSYKMTVMGQVSLWGRVIETENGFRAQFAYPKELWLLDETLEHLGYTYNVPIRTV